MATCPPAVLAVLRFTVQNELDKVRAIQRALDFVNLVQIEPEFLETLDQLVDAIPVVPFLNPASLVQYFTCPLTPIALSLDPTLLANMDPTVFLARARDLISAEIMRAQQAFEEGMANAPRGIRIVFTYFKELERIQFDEIAFAKALLVSASVAAVSQEEYDAGPYAEFIAVTSNFEVSNGLPMKLEGLANQVMGKFLQAKAKFTLMRYAAAGILVPVP